MAAAALTLACLAAEAWCRHTATLNHLPYTGLTLDPRLDYVDFSNFGPRFQAFHRPAFFSPQFGSPFLYPATVAMLYLPFYRLLPLRFFLVELSFFILLVVLWFRKALLRRGLSSPAATLFALGSAACSYPLYFEYNRANMEFFIWIVASLGIFAFLRDRPWQAATWIGLAGAFKFYPFLYLALLLARRQYKQAAWSFLVAAAFTLFSLWALTGNVAFSFAQTSAGVAGFRATYVLQRRFGELGLDHSIFGVYKRFALHIPPPDQLAHQLSAYLVVAAVVACIAWFARAIKLPVLNQVIFLTVACITLPPVSYDYTLLHLYAPFLLLTLFAIDHWKRREALPPGVIAAFLCFTLLLSPLNEFIVHGERISSQLKCLTLLALAAVSLLYPFASQTSLSPAEAQA